MKRNTLCTIRRTVKVTHGTMSMVGGASTTGRTEIVTEACGTPLFSNTEEERGICSSCAKGWSVRDNTFASEKEKARATGRPLRRKR